MFQSREGSAIIRTHRVGVLGLLRYSFFTTPHQRSPPPPGLHSGTLHPPLSPWRHEAFRAAEKWKFLYDHDHRPPDLPPTVSAEHGARPLALSALPSRDGGMEDMAPEIWRHL